MTYNLPYESEVMIIADSPDGAAEMVKIACKADEMPAEMGFKVVSCELISENIEADESAVADSYRNINKKVIN